MNFKLGYCLIILSLAFGAFARPSAPAGLLVNGVSNPMAIDRDATGFTWMSKDIERGERQTAYQIMISSDPKFQDVSTSVWTSGKVTSDQSASVEYTGDSLPPATRFWWKVRIWDQTGKASPYSQPAFFDTGLGGVESAIHLGWRHQSQSLCLFPKDLCDYEYANSRQGLCHGV
ncbi:MAG TPA: hypothetical protein VH280_15125 [Verrucomicrobiae bacterium]|jgi:hypothetical protein|nr:hypothetical protein [Verrucomicrobiae bacterium]